MTGSEEQTRERRGWREAYPAGRAHFRFRVDGGVWEEREGDEQDAILEEVRGGHTIEVENEGPEILTMRGETRYRFNDNDIKMDCYTPYGSLEAGARDVWKTLNETVYVRARPESVMIGRLEWLKLLRGERGRRSGEGTERIFRWFLNRRRLENRAIGTCRHDEAPRETPDLAVRLGGTETIWELKTLLHESEKQLADEQHGENRHGAVKNRIVEAAKQLRAYAEKGIPTLVGLMNLRGCDWDAVGDEAIADALYGCEVATVEGDEAWITHRSGRGGWDRKAYGKVSAVMTLGVDPAVAPWEERGKRLSDVPDDMRMIVTPRLFHCEYAETMLKPEAVRDLRTTECRWERVEPKQALVSRWVTRRAWNGRHESDGCTKRAARKPDGKGTIHEQAEALAGVGLEMMRGAIAQSLGVEIEAMERVTDSRRFGGRTQIGANRYCARLREEPPDIEETWARYVVQGGADDHTAVIAGTTTPVAEVLEQVAAGRAYEEIGNAAASRLLPGSDEKAAVKAAAAYAALVLLNEEDLPPDDEAVERVEGRCAGQPVIRQTRQRVAGILTRITAGLALETIAEETELGIERVRAAVRYARKAVLNRRDKDGKERGAKDEAGNKRELHGFSETSQSRRT